MLREYMAWLFIGSGLLILAGAGAVMLVVMDESILAMLAFYSIIQGSLLMSPMKFWKFVRLTLDDVARLELTSYTLAMAICLICAIIIGCAALIMEVS